MYKQAAIEKLRFNFEGNDLSTEQLINVKDTRKNGEVDTAISYLGRLGNEIANRVEATGKGNRFQVVTRTKEEELDRLRLAIVTDIYESRIAASAEAATMKEIKENEQLILEINKEVHMNKLRTDDAYREKYMADLQAKKAALKK